ncbi:hypothetical protein MJO29_006298 [Puccinia striiformis f. sp. tritici]|nr:hypothetical protein MJO29_006298 [Puccinia striiformis f. sp. tritici]
MAAAADCSPKNDYVKAAPTFQLQSATIISSQPLKTSAAKWIGPRLIDWVDETGMEHKWEVSYCKTAGESSGNKPDVKQISPQSFNQWKALYKETRHVIQEPEEYEIQGQPDLLTQDDKDFMTELIAAEPGLFLDEIREQVYDHSGTLVSPEAIQHCLTKKLGMTLKKAKVSNIRKNLIHKYDFIEKMEPIPAEFLVFTDKSSVCSRVLLRTNGATATLRLAKQCCSLAILGLLC